MQLAMQWLMSPLQGQFWEGLSRWLPSGGGALLTLAAFLIRGTRTRWVRLSLLLLGINLLLFMFVPPLPYRSWSAGIPSEPRRILGFMLLINLAFSLLDYFKPARQAELTKDTHKHA